MKTTKELIKQLEQEGFTQVRVCPLPPNKDLPQHTHNEQTVHIILEGELTIKDKTGTKTYKPGDRVEFAAGTTHKARGNSDNGTMVIGIKQEPFSIEQVFNAPVAKVWNAITNKTEMKQWYFDLVEFNPVVGFKFQFEAGEADKKKYLHLCEITEVIPNQKLTYSWKYQGYPGISYVTFKLFQQKNQTTVRLTHAGLESFPKSNPDLAEKNFAAGWTDIIGRSLKNYLEGKETTKALKTTTTPSQKIIPHLWFDTEAKEAAKFYTSIFPKSKVTSTTTIHNTPSGDCDIVSFELSSYKFMAISAGSVFKINPSISFILNFDPSKDKNARKNLDTLWKHLSNGGKALMPLDKYPFSEHYGWIQDKYGISWQLMLTNTAGEDRPFITPAMMFTKNVCGKAEEATQFYQSVFKNTKQGIVARYPKGMAPDKESTIMYTDFMLENQWFAAMDSGHMHDFTFNEAISFIVKCDTQDEIDYYSNKLSALPQAEQCGWLKDKFGVSWQIIPSLLNTMMQDKDQTKVDRVTQAFLKMKKFDIKTLEKVYKEE